MQLVFKVPEDTVIETVDNYSKGIKEFQDLEKSPTLFSYLIQSNLTNESQNPFLKTFH